jgi:hypothetical protein
MKTIMKNFAIAIGLMISSSFAVSAQDISGAWKGAITAQGMEIELIFNLSKEDGKWKSTLDVPIQGATDIPMDQTNF